MAIGSAIAAVAIGVGTTVYGAVQQNKAKKEYEERLEAAGDPTNPYAGLSPSTQAYQLNSQQNLRSEATQMNILSKAGSRGLALAPQISRNTALGIRRDAAELSKQQDRIDILKGRGNMFVQQLEEARLNKDLDGYANMYAVGGQNMAGGINQTMGALASGFAEGGAFNQGNSTATPEPSEFNTNYNPPAPQFMTPQTLTV